MKDGAVLDAIYFCPHTPDDNCGCRKPMVGLFMKAVYDFDIDMSRSYVVGDSLMDIVAGNRVGAKTVLIKHDGVEDVVQCHPNFISNNFHDAIEWILKN
jgi:histidinol-phosphate phosphatase family protein